MHNEPKNLKSLLKQNNFDMLDSLQPDTMHLLAKFLMKKIAKQRYMHTWMRKLREILPIESELNSFDTD